MVFENLSERPIEVQSEQADRWDRENLLEKCGDNERRKNPSFRFIRKRRPTTNGKSGHSSQSLSGR